MGLFDWLFGPSPTQTPPEAPQPIHLARGRGYTFDLVGESHYQDTLDALCGGKCEEGHRLPLTVQLCFQEDNPHEPNAIAVLVDREVVGYVPRHLAARMRDELLKLNPAERPVTCDAKIVGGWRRADEDEGHYGVKLSLSQPIKLARPVSA
jgi:hypothetical protein